jgi:hypothetical protein
MVEKVLCLWRQANSNLHQGDKAPGSVKMGKIDRIKFRNSP